MGFIHISFFWEPGKVKSCGLLFLYKPGDLCWENFPLKSNVPTHVTEHKLISMGSGDKPQPDLSPPCNFKWKSDLYNKFLVIEANWNIQTYYLGIPSIWVTYVYTDV